VRIGFDVDGVIYRFTKAYHKWLNENRGMSLDLEAEAQTWDWFTEWESENEFCLNLHDGVDSGQLYWLGELYENGIRQNLLDLRAAGHTIHVVTARLYGIQKCALEATQHFFHTYGLPYDSMTITRDKASVPTDVFLEDSLRNYHSLEASGIASYLVDRPYNRVNYPTRRVQSVDEFTKLILEDRWQSVEQSFAWQD
jgi:FMN phosphatase YigB (HAD superfamily)